MWIVIRNNPISNIFFWNYPIFQCPAPNNNNSVRPSEHRHRPFHPIVTITVKMLHITSLTKRWFNSCSKNIKNNKSHRKSNTTEEKQHESGLQIVARRPSLEYQAVMARSARVSVSKPEMAVVYEVYEVNLWINQNFVYWNIRLHTERSFLIKKKLFSNSSFLLTRLTIRIQTYF